VALAGHRLRELDRDGIDRVKAWCGVPTALERTWRSSLPSVPAEAMPGATPAEVAAFWDRCIPAPPAHPFLAARRLAPPPRLARFTPGHDGASWPAWWPAGRARTWRLATVGYRFCGDDDPELANLHARAVVDPPEFDGRRIKTLWAKGTSSEGCLFWNGLAPSTAVLCVVAEGLTDWLALCAWADLQPGVLALGLTSGGPAGLADVPLPRACPVVVATDDDEAGDAYAVRVASVLRHHRVLRAHPSLFLQHSNAAK
jgi:hypothetical protein